MSNRYNPSVGPVKKNVPKNARGVLCLNNLSDKKKIDIKTRKAASFSRYGNAILGPGY